MLHQVGHKFKRSTGKETPQISTSSMPDIIFILLFFFMMVTVMRDPSIKVRTTLPSATEVQKLEHKSLVQTMFIGPPNDVGVFGTAPRLQLADAFARPSDIGTWVTIIKAGSEEAKIPKLIYSIKGDIEVTMGLISDVKTELRKADALKLNYSTLVRSEVY